MASLCSTAMDLPLPFRMMRALHLPKLYGSQVTEIVLSPPSTMTAGKGPMRRVLGWSFTVSKTAGEMDEAVPGHAQAFGLIPRALSRRTHWAVLYSYTVTFRVSHEPSNSFMPYSSFKS